MTTIQFISNTINQLDLAIDQILLNDTNHDRFALILVDNVLELAFHNYAISCSNSSIMKLLGKEDEYEALIRKALGRNFDSKVKLAYEKKMISKEQYEIILIMHTYRNKAYHQGINDENIIHSLVVYYLITACEVLSNYNTNGVFSSSSTDKVTIRASKYIGNINSFSHNANIYNDCFSKVLEVAKNLEYDLKDDLHSNMDEVINEYDDYIKYLLDSPNVSNRDDVIIDCQALAITFTDKAKKFAAEKEYEENTVGEYIDWIKDNYPFKIKKDPISNWNIRLDSLKGSADNYKALVKYNDFMLQTQEIRDDILNSVGVFDEFVNRQIDMVRGK